MASTTSDVVKGAWRNVKDDMTRFNLTGEDLANKLHDQMVNKTVVITGVTPGGIGAEAARVVAMHSPKMLILASRSASTIEKTIADITAGLSTVPDIRPVVVDLGSQNSVRAAAAQILEMTPVIDVLMNNAAIMMLPQFQKSPEGIEMQFAVNHIGPFLFTNLLMPALLKSESGGRVVNVTSSGHHGSDVRYDDWNFQEGKDYESFIAYAGSKSANIQFAVSLAKKLGSKGIFSYSVDPGSVVTNLPRNIPKEELVGRGWFLENGEGSPNIPWKTAGQSVASYIMAAYDPEIKDQNGAFISVAAIDNTAAAYAVNPESAEKTWALSEKLVGQTFAY